MNIFYLNNDGNFQSSENSTVIKLEDMLQRLQTFTNEQSFNVANGIDYIGVFNKRSLLKPQIENIINQYTQYFQDITYLIENTSNNSISIALKVLLFSGDVAMRSFSV